MNLLTLIDYCFLWALKPITRRIERTCGANPYDLARVGSAIIAIAAFMHASAICMTLIFVHEMKPPQVMVLPIVYQLLIDVFLIVYTENVTARANWRDMQFYDDKLEKDPETGFLPDRVRKPLLTLAGILSILHFYFKPAWEIESQMILVASLYYLHNLIAQEPYFSKREQSERLWRIRGAVSFLVVLAVVLIIHFAQDSTASIHEMVMAGTALVVAVALSLKMVTLQEKTDRKRRLR